MKNRVASMFAKVITRKIIIICLVCIAFTGLGACEGTDRENQTRVPASARDFGRENYQDVISQLEEAGFTNIRTEVLDNLMTGWITRDGSVNQVSIDGNTTFSSGRWFPTDAEVIVTYHTFPQRTQREDENAASELEDVVEHEEYEEEYIEVETEDYILTVENSEILAEMFSTAPESARMAELVEEIRGHTIAFDGFIVERYVYSTWSPITGRTREWQGYSTVHLWEGNSEDGDAALSRGPFMRMDNVRDSDFPTLLTAGSMDRDTGGNVHVVAEIRRVEVSERRTTPFLILVPVSIEMR